MTLKEIRNSRWFRFFSNIYVLVLTVFVIWMLFFDTNSWWFTHRELNNEIKKLQEQKIHLKEAIEKDKATLKKLNSKQDLEKFAREQYYLKKEDEEIYLIEYEDSLEQN
ncbi:MULTISPECIES: FtsB family cell division protein [Galbibacter]|uniref:Septum formation initiator family protein n=1 Tax=Galbibacter pacificus TaxID=2996052 RepID=A0ABT6FNK0_9FLAO|nr:septum formation initiator family protein [Galbibacter pacificus]MDG3581362.1 septum formation initiator family protein [Galbibacter pacificus]MDG3584840.1 septum formation initiator family protein [Galbibacter pacificus]